MPAPTSLPACLCMPKHLCMCVCVYVCVYVFVYIYICVCVCVSVRMPSVHACMHASCLCMYHARLHDLLSGRDSAVHMTFDYLVYVCTLLGATEIGGGSACVLD